MVVTVSEGIGTGILANGQLVRGLSGMAGEFGHVPLDPNGPRLRLRQPRVLGGVRVEPRRAALLRRVRRRPAGISFIDLLSRADHGDARAEKALETMAHHLGRGMRMIVAGLVARAHRRDRRPDALLAAASGR